MRLTGALSLIFILCVPTLGAQTAPPWQTGTFVYDGAGNIKSIGTEQYRYDRYGRLATGTVAPGRTQSATYDVFGNILTLTTDGTTITMGVDGGTNRLTAPGNFNVQATYDLAGRLTEGPGLLFEYDALDAVMKSTVNGTTKVHAYSASNERILSVSIGSGLEEWTLRDPSAKVLRRIERQGTTWTWKEDYIYRGEALLASEIDGVAQTLHFFPDHLGTPRLITGNGGSKVAFHAYFPFGREWTSPAQDLEKLKFTSHERDALSLDYMHARYFVPSWGRFLSVDPTWDSADLGRPQSWNRYAYVENNPINKVDPDGKVGFLVFGAAIEKLADAAGLAYDVYTIAKEGPTRDNVGQLAADVVLSVAPIPANIGAVKLLDNVSGGAVSRMIGPIGDAAGRGLSRMDRFKSLAETGVRVGDQKFSINEHVINSVRKSGRRDITPESLVRALEGKAMDAKKGTRMYVDPKDGHRFFVDKNNEVVGVYHRTFQMQ